MQAIDRRTGAMIMAGLVAAGACLVAIDAVSPVSQVTGALPPLGAALIAAGTTIMLQSHALTARRSILIGIALLAAGVVIVGIGSTTSLVVIATSLPVVGGALATAGTLVLVSGAASLDPSAGVLAR